MDVFCCLSMTVSISFEVCLNPYPLIFLKTSIAMLNLDSTLNSNGPGFFRKGHLKLSIDKGPVYTLSPSFLSLGDQQVTQSM